MWVLIILLLGQVQHDGVAITQVDMESKASCQAAATKVKELSPRVATVCVYSGD